MTETNRFKDLDNFIGNTSQNISEIFFNIFRNGSLERFYFTIDAKKLDSKYLDKVNITLEGEFASMFQKLQEYEEYPALYFFQINPRIKSEEIISLIKSAKTTYNLHIPAENKSSLNSGVLYVGKVKRCAWGRLIQHLGYHQNRKSHGLQMDHWSNRTSLNIELSYTVMFFDKSVADHIHLLEYELAKLLNPIIGKH